MGRKRKAYTDNYKIDAVKEALHNGADRAEVAIKYNIAQSTLSEWIAMFLDGKILTDEQKALEETMAADPAQQTPENFQRYEHIKREIEQKLYEWEILSE